MTGGRAAPVLASRSRGPHALADVDVVVPTIGRPSLRGLLASLRACDGPRPRAITLVDDRLAAATHLLDTDDRGWVDDRLRVVRGVAGGPASARNIGWRMATGAWIAFLDDDVVVTDRWLHDLARDLNHVGRRVAGSQGRIIVSPPSGRRRTDWERNVAGLEGARWATADMAYRRAVLERLGGFDERFRYAYREDADLALRVTGAGYALARGQRHVLHPVRPADRWVSVRLQRGNADDVLMRALHGRAWRARAVAPAGRLRRHIVTVAGAGAALAGVATGRADVAVAGSAAWLAGTAELATARIAPGTRDAREVATMLATSAVLPFAAVASRARGVITRRRRLDDRVRAPYVRACTGAAPLAVLLDRDGTVVVDVPYNADPRLVVPVPGGRATLDRLRHAGLKLAVVSNQSGVGRGLLSMQQVHAVNAQIEGLVGPLGPFCVCPHTELDGCTCRKPTPGLLLEAARRLDVPPARCVVIGDTGADVDAALAAGARPILVPNLRTRREEIDAAPEVAANLAAAVDMVLAHHPDRATHPPHRPGFGARPTVLTRGVP